MVPPNKRSANFPSHINPEKLPEHTRFDSRWNGRWVYRKRQGGNRGREIRIGNADATLADLWNAVEQIESGQAQTLRGLSLAFQKSDDWSSLATSTQRDYLSCHKAICEKKTKSGIKTGDLPLEVWTPGIIRRYRDGRKKQSPSRAAHELRYLKRLFTWGIEYEYHAGPNPATGVKLKGLSPPRTHYPQDDAYNAALNIAPLKIACMAHLAYLTGRRRQDIAKLHRADLTKDGILFAESKTDKASIVSWSEELRHLVDLIKEESPDGLYLFPGHRGEHYKLAALDTAWQRVRGKLIDLGLPPFQFKDIRAKHATDFDEAGGDATENLLHSSEGLTKLHYLRKPKKILPLR